MNIFFLSVYPAICAQYHCDKHVVKMILESCQMLCTAHHLFPSTFTPPYKKTHAGHPCTKWVCLGTANYQWLCELALCLCREYTYRYNRVHKCEEYIVLLSKNLPNIPFTKHYSTPAQAMPDQYKCDDAVIAYRNYYLGEKSSFLKWTRRKEPKWVAKPSQLNIILLV